MGVMGAFGSIVTYFIFIGGFLSELPLWSLDAIRTRIIVALAACPFLFADTVGSWSSLAKLSLLSLAAMATVVLIEAPHYAAVRDAGLCASGDIAKIPGTLCVCVFALNWHSN